MAYDWADAPLPPIRDDMQLARAEHFDHLKPDSFKSHSGSLEIRNTEFSRITGGLVGVKVFRSMGATVARGIPWHWHELGMHISYVIKGWAVFEFEGVGVVRLEAGTLIHQPPFNRHRELEQSEDFEVIEITLPGTIKNVFMDYDESSKDWTYSDTYKGRNTK